MTAFGALWLRQMKRFYRTKTRALSSLAQPILFLFAFGFGFAPIYASAGGGDYISFIVPGIVCMSSLATGVFSGLEIIWDKQIGFLRATLIAPVSRTQIVLGRIFGGATLAFVNGMLVFAIALLIGFRPAEPSQLPAAALFLSLVSFLATAIGSAVAIKVDDMQAFPVVMNFVVLPMFFLSGALFPLDQLPDALYLLSAVNPVAYGVDGVRGALSGTHHFSYLVDALVLVGLTVLVVVIGVRFFDRMEA